MKTTLFLCCLFTAFVCALGCGEQALPTTPKPEMTAAEKVKHGEYLVGIMGCDDCHSPKIMTPQGPAPDPERRLSGHPAKEALPAITNRSMIGPGQWALFNAGLTAAVGPWGTTFSANLTPHETGLGAWTLEQFDKALREGKAKGMDNGRMLLPPMPWANFRRLTDEDLAAMFAYLKTLKPVDNLPPSAIPPAPAE